MEHDDEEAGRLVTRRGALALIGAGGAALLAGAFPGVSSAQSAAALPRCIARPQQTEGPYFVDERLNRSDIRSDPATGAVKPGVPLRVAFRVSRISGGRCTALTGARVDLWHCDAAGAYSDVRNFGFSTVGQKFLRGYQLTDGSGFASFTTIYPGWYKGRTVHLHFKIRTDPTRGRGHEFTSQIYFEDALSDRVLSQAPYASRGRREVRNEHDGIFRRGGERLLLALEEDGGAYAGTFDVGLTI